MLVRFAQEQGPQRNVTLGPKESWDVEPLGVILCVQHSCGLALALGT